MSNGMRPIHPGEILRSELDELGMSASALAQALRVPVNRITGILNGRRAVSADTALRLARYFDTSAEFWLNLQSAYELRIARRGVEKQIIREVRPRTAA
jgi:addiction module HigA family antidote